jgi:hypothetical protein
MNMKNAATKIKKFVKEKLKNLKETYIKISAIDIIVFLIIVLLAAPIYNFSIDVSKELLRYIPDDLESSSLVQFLDLLVPIITISFLIHVLFPKIPARIFRLGLISIHIFVEIFLLEEVGIEFASYMYFYITVETLFYLIHENKIKIRKEKENGPV